MSADLLAEVTARLQAGGYGVPGQTPTTATVHRFSLRGHFDGANWHDERIIEAPTVRRELFGRGRVRGRSEASYGVLRLANRDGALDGAGLLRLDSTPANLVGQPVVFYSIPTPGAAAVELLRLACAAVRVSREEVALDLRDEKLPLLDGPLQANRYGGTNTLPNGLDGTADIRGRPKPLVFGRPFNVEPVLVNSAKLIYQVHDGAINSALSTVQADGVDLTKGADYAIPPDIEDDTKAPAAGSYRWYPLFGMFRLGAPVAKLTANPVVGSTAQVWSAAGILKTIAQRGSTGITVSSSDETTLHSQAPSELGVYLTEDVNRLDLMDQVAASVGAWYFLSGSQLRIGRLELVDSGAVPAHTFDADTIASVAVSPQESPAASVRLAYGKNHSPIEAPGATAPTFRRNRLPGEWLFAEATGGASATDFPGAAPLAYETLLAAVDGSEQQDLDAVVAEAARVRDLFKVPRLMLDVELADAPDGIDLHQAVRITWPRFGLASGRLLRVIGIERRLGSRRASMTLWG